MISIPILSFTASYLVVFALEVTRIFFRSGIRSVVMLGFAAAGLLAHTLFLVNRWFAGQRAPLSSEFDWYLVVAWVLVLIYFFLAYFHPRNPIGLFCLPLVLGLVAMAWFWASTEPFPKAEGTRLWRITHGGSLLLGTVAVMIGFVSGVMYLLQVYRLKHKLPPRQGFELPSLEWLSRIGERAIVLSVILLLAGVATGMVLSGLAHGAVWWSDPVVWSSSLLAAWMVVVAVFNFTYKPARQGRKVAYLTVATFVFLLLTLVALLFGHNYENRDSAARAYVPLAPEGRPSIARGVSPWEFDQYTTQAPKGRHSETAPNYSVAPPGLASCRGLIVQGLTPLAIDCRRSAAVNRPLQDSPPPAALLDWQGGSV
jgi:ABC-type transport system involved in cytochrome c biogenesis permease subunit